MNAEVRIPFLYEERFGIRIALADNVRSGTLPDILEACRADDVRMLIGRCPVEDISAAHAMEQAGFLLMDTLLYFRRRLDLPLPPGGDIPLRLAGPEDAPTVEALAAAVFAGYSGGHFHADERLDRAACDAVYTSWAASAVLSPDPADAVLLAEAEGAAVGFLTLRRLSPEEGEGPLIGVASAWRGRGIARALMIGGLGWLRAAGTARMLMSTHVSNTRSQRVWARLGFEPDHAFYTFHKWFA